MKLKILYNQLEHFTEMLISLKTLRDSLNELPDEMELTVSFEKDKNQPGGMIKDGQLIINRPQTIKTVAQRKEELDRDIQIVGARVKVLKLEIIKELQKED